MSETMQSKKSVYLGDGAYATNDGFHIIIYTDDGYGPKNQVFLGDTCFEKLMEYAKQIGWIK